jgi:hypothetical protein
MTTDKRHRYGCDNRKITSIDHSILEFDFARASRGEIVLDGMSAREVCPSIYGMLVRRVAPALRHLGCMWLPDGDEALRCNKSVRWTMGDGSTMPRVYCDAHGRLLRVRVNAYREAELAKNARIREGKMIPRRTISAQEREEIIGELIAGKFCKGGIWRVAQRHHCHISTVSRIAGEVGLDRNTRVGKIRDDIVHGLFGLLEVAERNGITVAAARYHFHVCGIAIINGQRVDSLDGQAQVADTGADKARPGGVAAPPAAEAIQEGA